MWCGRLVTLKIKVKLTLQRNTINTMKKEILAKANQLDYHLAAIIALPGNPVQTAINVYNSFSDVQKECALWSSRDLLEKAIELQEIVRHNQYLMDGYHANLKPNFRYLGIDYYANEIIKGDELLAIFNRRITKEKEEIEELIY